MIELTIKELDTLARVAHDIGAESADERPHTPEQIEQIGTDTLERLVTLLQTEQVRRLFVLNFQRGYRFAQSDSSTSKKWADCLIPL